MGIALATVLVTVILVSVGKLSSLIWRLDPLLALVKQREHARLARAELAEIDRKYEELVARHE